MTDNLAASSATDQATLARHTLSLEKGRKHNRDVDITASPLDDAASVLNASSATLPQSPGAAATANSTTNFRNVSACNRCRNRKNRCDQKLPKCSNCVKAKVDCVGFDPVSKREIPRSYVYYLETRVHSLESILTQHGIKFPAPREDFSISETIKPGINVPFPIQDDQSSPSMAGDAMHDADTIAIDPVLTEADEGERLKKLISKVGVVPTQSAPESQYANTISNITFAKVVFAAVKRTRQHTPSPSEKSGKARQHIPDLTGGGTTMRDSFFGLHTKPTIKAAPFPEKELGLKLTELYFEHANPQIPVLHRGEFMDLFNRVYDTEPKRRTPRELYLLNIVFAIGSGIIMDSSNSEFAQAADDMAREGAEPSSKKARFTARQHQPEEYHSSAIVHLENFLGSTPATEGVAGGLEELQAVVLLAGLALLRPVAPGLWYIIGVAVRLSIDLGLYFEDINIELDNRPTHPNSDHPGSVNLGKKQWTRDLRRRLWWCVFNLDRLVSSCVGRPVSINEAVVTTELPSMLDDKYIAPSGFLRSPSQSETPSYKLVSRHYIRLRLLQSEILQVLQHKQADQARSMGAHQTHEYINRDLANPFLRDFDSFREWRADLDRRLWEWKETAPSSSQTGVAFNPLFLELNYWQAIIMLYRQSLSVPEPLASELGPATGDDVHSPGAVNQEIEEDKQFVFLKVAQAGQTVLKIYRQLHREKLVNYTFLATHHLFMSGISFLYAIWHSPLVRSLLTIDDVDFTVLAATSVLNDLIVKCPPAEACKDAFHRMSQATISMVRKTTGFGNTSSLSTQRLHHHDGYFNNQTHLPPSRLTKEGQRSNYLGGQPATVPKREYPKFDMNLRDLFSAEEIENRTVTNAPRRPIQLSHPRKKRTTSTDKRARANTVNRNTDAKDPSSPSSPSHPLSSTETPHSMNFDATSVHSLPSSQFSPLQQRPRLPSVSYQTANQHVYQPFVETISQDQPDFIFEHLDFLNDLPVVDPNGFWGHHHNISMDDASFMDQQQNQHSGAGPGDTGLSLGTDAQAGSVGTHDSAAVAAAFLFDSNDASGFEGSGAWANSELMNTYWFGANGNGNGF